jgi:hypothetical protein
MANIGTTSIDMLPTAPLTQMPMQQMQGQQMPMQGQQMQMQMPMQGQQMQMPGQGQGQGQGQMSLHTYEKNIVAENPAQVLQQQRQDDPAVMQRQMNQFVTGLQQASAAGLTALPARDIPQQQDHLVRDEQMRPNYVPTAQLDYIPQETAPTAAPVKNESLDVWYDELQGPLLLAALYFLFQLPLLRQQLNQYLPSLFEKSGQPNLGGYVFHSLMYAGVYYALNKARTYFAV